MSLAILFHFLCAQHVSDINISIIRSLRLFCCASACNTDTTPTQSHWNSNTHRTKNNTTNVVIQQNSRKLLMIDKLMSETCWAHKKWNKIASDIKLVFYSSIHTHHFLGPQILSYNSQTRNLSEETHNTPTKQTTQYNTNKQMSVLQSPKSNTVHSIIIKQYNTNYNRNNLSN